MPERVIRTLDGKRGSFLLLSGLFYILIGLTYEVVSTPTRSAAFQWLPEAMNPQVLGVVWLVGGGASVVIALCPGGRHDWNGSRSPRSCSAPWCGP